MKRYTTEVNTYKRNPEQNNSGEHYKSSFDKLEEAEIFMFAKTANLDREVFAYKATMFDNGKEVAFWTNDLNNIKT